VDPLPIGG